MTVSRIPGIARLATFLVLGLGLAGCQAAGGYDEKLQTASLQARRSDAAPPPTLLVVIRYPSLFEPSAGGILNVAHVGNSLNLDPRIPNSPRNPWPFTDSLIKTNYYVLEFYEALRARLPENTVALQPQRIVWPRGTFEASTGHEVPPAVVHVDFMTYVHPYKFLTNDSNTFGKYISPLVTIRTSPAAAPQTRGALAGTQALRPKVHTPVGKGAAEGLGYTLIDRFNDVSKGEEAPLDVVSAGPLKPGQYLEVPQANITMDEEAVLRAAATPGGLPDGAAPSRPVMESLAGIVIQALNAVDHQAAVREDMTRYIAAFDTGLSSRFAANGLSAADAAKLALIHEFIALERAFLGEHDRNLRATTYRGAFGDSVRQLLAGEMQHYADFWGQQIMASMLILGTGLASGAATGNYMPSTLWDIYFQSEQSKEALDNAFERHFAGVRTQQMEFTVRLSDKVRKIRVGSLRELRDECARIYSEEFGGAGS